MILTHDTPATKKHAYDLITVLKLGGTLSESEIDSLLLYFCPAHPKKVKTAMEWVAKAAAVNDVRKHLLYIHVSNGFATASDGARIHKARVDLADGYYCPKTLLPTKCDLRYLPDSTIDSLLDISRFDCESVLLSETATGTQVYDKKITKYYEVAYGLRFYAGYVQDACNGENIKLTYANNPTISASNLIVGESQFGKFCIKGLNL